ncbi:LacI family DNA-binding transcriptional regulator [Pseudarthrobacter sulfonivorans]
MRDVAALAGVAASTVSRALTAPDRVSEETRIRIEDAARQLEYVSLERPRNRWGDGRHGMVALVVHTLENPFCLDVMRGVDAQLRAAGFRQMVVTVGSSPTQEKQILEELQGTCDGAVLVVPTLDESAAREINKRLPMVTINRDIQGVPSIIIDTPSASVQAMEHLVALGHSEITYIRGDIGTWNEVRCLTALEDRGKELGVAVRSLGPFSPHLSQGAAAADAAVHAGSSACLVFNDIIALGMLERLRTRGIRVPQDISIVGCDDIFGTSMSWPPLTTISTPAEQAGLMAASALLDAVGSRKGSSRSSSTTLSPRLIIRESVGPAPAHG